MLTNQGLTYRQVKGFVQELADNIPDVDIVCEAYTLRHSPATPRKKGKDASDDEVVMIARIGKMSINLIVQHFTKEENS